MTRLEEIREEQAKGARTQDRINTLRLRGEIEDAIRSAAYERAAKYPQYAGHWDGEEWQLGFITKPIRTKMGMAFRFADVVLFKNYTAADAIAFDEPGMDRFVTAYSVRNGIDTSVPKDSIEELAFTTRYRHPEGLVWMEAA